MGADTHLKSQNGSDREELEYLTFAVDNEQYGFPILSVIDIRGWEEPTYVPNCSLEMKGIINIRGVIVPIIDLRIKFGMEEKPHTKFTVTIVVKIKEKNGTERVIGFTVDSVTDVYKISKETIKPPPLETSINKQYIDNIAIIDEKMVIMLNPNQLINEVNISNTLISK